MKVLRALRVVGFLEGVSFLVLLFVAMPLKYAYGQPGAVRVVGAIHGGLFLLFVAALYGTAIERNWRWRRSLTAFVASLVPFGTFVLDRSLRREQGALGRPAAPRPARANRGA